MVIDHQHSVAKLGSSKTMEHWIWSMNYHIPDLPKLVIPECKGWGSGGEQYKQVVSVPVHSVSLVALQRRANTLYYWSVYIAMYNTHSTSFSYTFHVQWTILLPRTWVCILHGLCPTFAQTYVSTILCGTVSCRVWLGEDSWPGERQWRVTVTSPGLPPQVKY